jgi:hypothetical protein
VDKNRSMKLNSPKQQAHDDVEMSDSSFSVIADGVAAVSADKFSLSLISTISLPAE